MITVLIKGEESLYRKGMQCLLEALFYQMWQQDVTVLSEFTQESVSQADIIMLGLGPGEKATCIPELQHRQKGIIIGLTDAPTLKRDQMPNCYQDMVMLSRKASLTEVRKVIAEQWAEYCLLPSLHFGSRCYRCRHETLSLQQSRVMAFLYKGFPVANIAHKLKISDKTVFSHKYLVMQRFNLHSDYELHSFLGNLAGKNIPSNYFRECLGKII
ncbi:DNA-binding response regulator [Enterobacteriaceae bacterium 89]|nr:DNA-binding response regulator [Enterobacteriaceae bacterium 89]